MSVKIKIGGLKTLEEIDFINEAKPDFAGVTLNQRYLRGISLQQARAIRDKLAPSIPLVGMFVNGSYMDVLVALRQGIIDIAQLQGTESEEYIRDLKFMSRKPVIKACQMDSPDVIPYALNTCADYILFGMEPDSGKTFDWSMVQDVRRPFFLSGALNPDNVIKAIKAVHPWGVDFAVDSDPNGVMDSSRLLSTVAAIRSLPNPV